MRVATLGCICSLTPALVAQEARDLPDSTPLKYEAFMVAPQSFALRSIASEVYAWHALFLERDSGNTATHLFLDDIHHPFDDMDDVVMSYYTASNVNNAVSWSDGAMSNGFSAVSDMELGAVAMRVNGDVERRSPQLSNTVGFVRRNLDGVSPEDRATTPSFGITSTRAASLIEGAGKVTFNGKRSIGKAEFFVGESLLPRIAVTQVSLTSTHMFNIVEGDSPLQVRDFDIIWHPDFDIIGWIDFMSGGNSGMREQDYLTMLEFTGQERTGTDQWIARFQPVRFTDGADPDMDWIPSLSDRFRAMPVDFVTERELYPYAPAGWWESLWLGTLRKLDWHGSAVYISGDLKKVGQGELGWVQRWEVNANEQLSEAMRQFSFYLYHADTEAWYWAEAGTYPVMADLTNNRWVYWWAEGNRMVPSEEWAPPPED